MVVEGSVQWQGEASANSCIVYNMRDMGMGENACGSEYSWGGCIQ